MAYDNIKVLEVIYRVPNISKKKLDEVLNINWFSIGETFQDISFLLKEKLIIESGSYTYRCTLKGRWYIFLLNKKIPYKQDEWKLIIPYKKEEPKPFWKIW